MRRWGILVFFLLTPIAQILLLRQHYKILPLLKENMINPKLLNFQFFVVVLMLVVGIVSGYMDLAEIKTDESDNIVEWNVSILLQFYFFVMVFIWKDFSYKLSLKGF